jgi:uncharacterized repeat protein (TIGR01451 family)
MRRIAYVLVGLALVGAGSWYCSSDAPAPTPPGTGGGGTTGASTLQIRLFTSNPNPVAGTCTVIQAVATLNGANVPDGTGIALTTDLPSSFFQQNLLPRISVVTQGGTATTALCSTVAGLATVRASATIGAQSGSATIAIAFQPSPQVSPFLTFCAPSFGPSTGGTTLIINGGRFFGDVTTTRATFTAAGITREALVTAVSSTAVTVITPAFPEATSPSVPVSITLTFGTKSASPVTLSVPNCFAFGTAAPGTPTITAVLPSSGSNEGNTLVTIIGTGFVSPLQVFFGPVEAQVLSVGFNQIIVLTPPASGAGLPNLNQTVTVRVHEITSGVDASLTAAFRFVTAIQITAIANGQQRVDQVFTPVTIFGQGFLSPVAVTLAGIPAHVISVSATELLVLPGAPFVTGCADIKGPTQVTNIDSGATATGPEFIYLVAQTKAIISSVTPSSGAPGTEVHINGRNLANITNVTIGGKAAPIIATPTDTEVVVLAPDNGTEPPACPPGTPGGTPVNVGAAVDVVVTSAATGCTATAPGAFQYKLPCVAPTPTGIPATGTPTPTVTPLPTATPTPGPVADLALVVNDFPDPVAHNSDLTYQLTVTNNGPNTASGVVLNDFLPVGTTFVSCTTAPPGTCPTPINPGDPVVANLNNIPFLGVKQVVIVVHVEPAAVSPLSNTAVVNSPSTPDPAPANNIVITTTTVNP